MELYYSPLACSMATRIALYELDAPARFVEVDPKTKRLPDGSDYRALHPLGLVPLLRTDEGELLTENAAILQHVADHVGGGRLAPADGRGRTHLHQWLCFIGTELHKPLFTPLLDPSAPEAVKAYALEKAGSRIALLDRHLSDRQFLLDDFSVADAYLFTVLHWTVATPVDLSGFPGVRSYLGRVRERPSVARALQEETARYLATHPRPKAS